MPQPIGLTAAAQVLRTRAALPAAGAYDAAPIELPCREWDFATLFFDYERGGAAGAFDFMIEVSPFPTDRGGSEIDWYQLPVYFGGVVVAGQVTSNIRREEINYTPAGATQDAFPYGPIEFQGTISRIRVPAQESGNLAAPGDLGIWVTFGRIERP